MPFPTTHPALARALEKQGYAEPTPVQAAVLEAPTDRDLLVSAQTGSGKTVAFGLAAAHQLLGEADAFGPAEEPLGLAIAPTRELALQVARELEWLYGPAGAKIVTCVGGMDARREQRALAAGSHIVVGTPGRLRDHLERGNLILKDLRVAVLDEADEMLDMGFREDLEEILDSTPVERRTLLFSATLPKDIVALARRYQREAHRIDTIRRDEAHGDIEYRAVRCAPTELENAVVNLLRWFESPGALIFCATRESVRHLHSALRERGFAAVQLSGELSQKERADALQSLRDGHARACVATDVAARGLDLPDLGLVIHAELPINKAALLHRSGRTGRAGKKGTSVLLVPHNRRRKAEQLLDSAGVEAEWSGPPTADEVRTRDQERLLTDPLLTEPVTEQDLVLARRLVEERGAEAVAAALVRLHRARLPEPEDILEDTGHAPSPRDRAERPQRGESAYEVMDASWFRISLGRKNNADPKWLIPLICRLGHVTKADIGQIRIFDRETKFEIARGAEARFRQAVSQATDDRDLHIEPAGDPGMPERRPSGPRRGPPPRRGNDAPPRSSDDRPPRKPYAGKPAGGKPRDDRPSGGKPPGAKLPRKPKR